MKKQSARWGCLLGGFLILLLVASGSWLFIGSQNRIADAPPDSLILVFLLTPSNGDEVEVGDFVPVTVQAAAPEPITRVELFLDGQSLGAVTDSPEDASWTWQALNTGVHTLFARAMSADGKEGQSQTVIINVFAGDGVMEVQAEEGQTLERIGAGFGVPSDQIIGANPNVDPTQPLSDGYPVQVPVGKGDAGDAGTDSGFSQDGGLSPISLILWQFSPTEPVDQSYCYVSAGDGNWEKMPKNPFEFFVGLQMDYIQQYSLPTADDGIIQIQCWGWLGGVLKFLGQGEAQYDLQQPPQELVVNGDGFQLIGLPQFQPKEEQFTGGTVLTIPPPFAMREPENTEDCTQHYGNVLAGFVCDTLLNKSPKQYYVLEWEWQPKTNWPGYETWFNEIDGYRIYEIDPLTQAEKYLKEISDPGQKVTAVPLPWGGKCYGVQAFTNDPAIESSPMATYCPGEPPAPQIMTLTPTDWITTGGQWIESGDCDTYGGADSYMLANQNNGFGNQPGEVLVGSYIVDDDDEDCFRQGDYSGAVKFGSPGLPLDAIVQRAVLKFSSLFTDYGASGVATNYKLFCVGGVGKAKQDWTGLGDASHFVNKNVLSSSAYNNPITSLSGWNNAPEVDVTSAVKNWIKNPQQNYGFILTPLSAPSPAVDGSGICESGAGNFQLEIHYFTPSP